MGLWYLCSASRANAGDFWTAGKSSLIEAVTGVRSISSMGTTAEIHLDLDQRPAR